MFAVSKKVVEGLKVFSVEVFENFKGNSWCKAQGVKHFCSVLYKGRTYTNSVIYGLSYVVFTLRTSWRRFNGTSVEVVLKRVQCRGKFTDKGEARESVEKKLKSCPVGKEELCPLGVRRQLSSFLQD